MSGTPPVMDSPWVGQTFQPPTSLGVTAIEAAIVAQLQTFLIGGLGSTQMLEVTHFPDKPEAYELRHHIGVVMVVYTGSDYGPIMDTGAVVQERTMEFSIGIRIRDLGWAYGGPPSGLSPGAYQLIELIRMALLGFVPMGGCNPMWLRSDRFVERDKQGGVWVYELKFCTRTLVVQNMMPPGTDTSDFPLFVYGKMFEKNGLTTTFAVGGGQYTFVDDEIDLGKLNVSAVTVKSVQKVKSALVTNGLTSRSGFNSDVLDVQRGVYWSMGNPSGHPGSTGLVKLNAVTCQVLSSSNSITGDGVTAQGGYSLGADGNLYFISGHVTDGGVPGFQRASLSRIDSQTLHITGSTPTVGGTPNVWIPGFIRNRYGYCVMSQPNGLAGVNVIRESDLSILVAAYPLAGVGMADLDASLHVWYFARVGSGTTGNAVLYEYSWNPAGASNQQLVLMNSWDLTSRFPVGGPPLVSPPGPGCCCLYLSSENALVLSVDGNSLLKWDIASRAVTGAESKFGATSRCFWGTVGQYGSWQQGEVSGQLAFSIGGTSVAIIDVATWQLVMTVHETDFMPPLLASSGSSGIQYDSFNGWVYVTQVGANNDLSDLTSGMGRMEIYSVPLQVYVPGSDYDVDNVHGIISRRPMGNIPVGATVSVNWAYSDAVVALAGAGPNPTQPHNT